MADAAEISLRPMVLTPGGTGAANPFASFGKGAGFTMKLNKTSTSAIAQAETEVERKRTGPVIRYSKDFLMKFMEQYTKCPSELQGLQLDVLISDEADRSAQRQALQQVVEEIDDRDWRTRAPPPAAPTSAPTAPTPAPARSQTAVAQADTNAQLQENKATNVIQKASDLGREAYRPGAAVSSEERTLRQVKGILNKLTPEKFERLLSQLLEVVLNADTVKQTMTLVFENAVAQPTFCAMYADLCLRLSKELPSFPAAEGEDKPTTFTRILLNACQDEFEGAEQAREILKENLEPEEREAAERRVKQRMLGTVRLISELYKQAVVKEKIMLVCIRELLSKTVPPEDNIEAVCEMITISGGLLANSSNAESKKMLDAFMARLQRLSDERSLSSRVRFLIRDVLDLKKTNWTPRRETFTAKKLDEVRAEAEAELGLISSAIAANLPTLPSQQRMAQEDFALLPPLKGEDGWEVVGKKGVKSFTGTSALVGDYQPMPKPAPAPAKPAPAPTPTPAPAPTPVAAAPAAAPAKSGKALSEEDLDRKAQSSFEEFCSVGDKREVTECVKELQSLGFSVKLVGVCIRVTLDSVKEADQEKLIDLLVDLLDQGVVPPADLQAGLQEYTSQLEDLSLDVPRAPGLLGKLYGKSLACSSNALPLAALPELLEGDYGVEPKRKFAAAAFQVLKSKSSEAEVVEKCKSADLKLGEILKADPEFDADAPSTEDFLKQEKLSFLPL